MRIRAVLFCVLMLAACDGSKGADSGSAAPTERTLDGRTLDEWLAALDNGPEKRLALRSLQDFGVDDPRVVPAVANLLGDADDDVRRVAGETLAIFGDAGLAAAASQLTQGSADARAAAAAALASARPRGLPPLAEALGSKQPSTQRAVLDALRSVGDAAREPLEEILLRGSLEQRREALTLLGEIDGAPRLVSVLEDGALGQIAYDALFAMGEEARSALTSGAPGPTARALLQKLDAARADALIAQLPERGDAVVDEIVAIGAPAVDGLVAALATEDAKARASATVALVRLGSSAEEATAQQLTSESEHARIAATHVLLRMDTRSSRNALVRALAEPGVGASIADAVRFDEVRGKTLLGRALVHGTEPAQREAARALAQMGPAGLEELVRIASVGPGESSRVAAMAITTLGEDAAAAIIDLLASSDTAVSGAATAALEQLGAAGAPALLTAAARPAWAGRAAALQIVRVLGKAAAPAVIDAALSGTPEERAVARELMSGLGANAVEQLGEAATGLDVQLRTAAIHALAGLATTEAGAVDILLDAFRDDSADVRYAAVSGIAALGTNAKSHKKRLEARLKDDDERVRVAAAGALLGAGITSRSIRKVIDAGGESANVHVRVAVVKVDVAAADGVPGALAVLLDALDPEEPLAVREYALAQVETYPVDGAIYQHAAVAAAYTEKALRERAQRLLDQIVKDAWASLSPRTERAEQVEALRSSRDRDARERVKAVDRALAWLAAHQAKDGRWHSRDFIAQCGGISCRGRGHPAFTTGLTGLAVLAFTTNGHTPESGEYAEVVRKGLQYLIATQDADGSMGMGSSIYNHAFAAHALVDAYSITGAHALRGPSQRAVNFIYKAQNPYLAWRYGVRDGDNDTSVTGCMVAVLRAADEAGLDVDHGSLRGAMAWVEKMTEPEFGRVGYQTRGGQSQRYADMHGPFPVNKTEALTALGVTVRLAYGASAENDEFVIKGLELMSKKPPEWDPDGGVIDFYYWYWGTIAMRQAGGRYWEQWRTSLDVAAFGGQIHNLDPGAHSEAGSWPEWGPWAQAGGRIWSTVAMCLSLQAEWRYESQIEKRR